MCVCVELRIIFDVNLFHHCFASFRCFKEVILCLALVFKDFWWMLPHEMEFVLFYKRIEWGKSFVATVLIVHTS